MIIINNNTTAALKRLAIVLAIISVGTLAMSFSKTIKSIEDDVVYEYGKASYYGGSFLGRKTANGEIFTESDYTCAHKTLPFGTKLKVTNLSTGKAIIVKVNDRGPYVKSRIVDLSIRGARELGLIQSGIANVSIEIVHSDFSSLGNVDHMEKIKINDTYAYVHRDDIRTFDRIIDHFENEKLKDALQESDKLNDSLIKTEKESQTSAIMKGTNEDKKKLVVLD